MRNQIENIGIVGGGKMGTSLFNFLSDLDFRIIWFQIDNVEKAKSKFERKFARKFKNKIISEQEYKNKIESVIITEDINQLSEVDIIIECIIENQEIKKEQFSLLDKIVKPNTIFASNSSSILPSELSDFNNNSRTVVGLHFFYPVEFKNIVEFIYNEKTSETSKTKIKEFLNRIGKFCLEQSEENAFFINKIMLEIQLESYLLYQNKGLSFSVIDEIIKRNLFDIGVFEMMDNIGAKLLYESIIKYTKGSDTQEKYLPLIMQLSNFVSAKENESDVADCFYKMQNNDEEITFSKSQEDIVVSAIRDAYKKFATALIEKKVCEVEALEFAMSECLGLEEKLNL